MNYLEKYSSWLNSDIIDNKTKEELKSIRNNKEIEDRFYKDLEFGTGGLRGIIGAGSNRMNVYTVGKATQGLADYLMSTYKDENLSVSIAYDSRIMSKNFAETASRILCGNGVKVNLFESLRPTPVLSYAVKYLKSKAGIVVTASHNPKQYNGYKVYGEDGGQVTDKKAKEIISYVNGVKQLTKIKTMDLKEAKTKGLFNIIEEEIDKTYIENVKGLTIREELVKRQAENLKIIYTPIHGSGNIPVRRVLGELGYKNLYVVPEQEMPDGNFPTVEYPNPENKEVFKIALNMAQKINPDIIFGTDPDCDRIGVIVKDKKDEYKALNGNMIGVLLTNYILSSLNEKEEIPKDGVIIKTIVTTELATKIAENFNVEVMNVLTGFKYIGEKIKEFSEMNSKTYLFGFEESYGYLAGTFVRDKDAVVASVLICEMALYYKEKGMSLYDALIEIYKKYGFYKENLISINLEGKEGQKKIENILKNLRLLKEDELRESKIVKKYDYKTSIEKNLVNSEDKFIDLPKSNVLKFILEDGSYFVIRPSGTEPKIKIYLSVIGNSLENSEKKMEKFQHLVMDIITAAFKYV